VAAKFVLAKSACPYRSMLTLRRSGTLRATISHSKSTNPSRAEPSIRVILRSWNIAKQMNVLPDQEGTGHGRTLPTGVSPDLALLVAREVLSMLTTLDRQFGRVVDTGDHAISFVPGANGRGGTSPLAIDRSTRD
jgi:hypothetical protein